MARVKSAENDSMRTGVVEAEVSAAGKAGVTGRGHGGGGRGARGRRGIAVLAFTLNVDWEVAVGDMATETFR